MAHRRSVSAGSQPATRLATRTSATRSADLCDRIASTVAMRLAYAGGTRPEQQRSLGSERGLATPSPDGKGEIPLGPSMKIMPVDSYSTLGRSCEPAFKRIFWPSPTDAARRVTRWRVAGPRRAARRRAARSPAREAHPRSSRPGLGPDPLAGDRGRNVRARPVVPNSDIRATLP